MTCISVLLIYIATKKKSKVFYLLAILPIFLVSALRYNLGTDYQIRYVRDFNQMAMGIDVETLDKFRKLNISFFFNEYIDRWDILDGYLNLGVTDVYIVNELGFEAD